MFWFSRVLRICESLEKHSGVILNTGRGLDKRSIQFKLFIFRWAALSTLSTLCSDGFPLPRYLHRCFQGIYRGRTTSDHQLHHHHGHHHLHHGHHLHHLQMPHHHDWHHEGHKGCNYTFTSLGGLWDCKIGILIDIVDHLLFKVVVLSWKQFKGVFGTRKTGRHPRAAETREDRQMAAAQEKRCLGILMLFK